MQFSWNKILPWKVHNIFLNCCVIVDLSSLNINIGIKELLGWYDLKEYQSNMDLK